MRKILAITSKAQKEANDSYNIKPNKKIKTNCKAPQCIIFTIDEQAKLDQSLNCMTCQQAIHLRCEGILRYNEDEPLKDYECTKCEGGSLPEQMKKIEMTIKTISSDMASVERDVTETQSKITYLDQQMTEDLGPRQKKTKTILCRFKNSNIPIFCKVIWRITGGQPSPNSS